MFSAKFTTVIFWKNDYDDENSHRCFLILYYNNFQKFAATCQNLL